MHRPFAYCMANASLRPVLFLSGVFYCFKISAVTHLPNPRFHFSPACHAVPKPGNELQGRTACRQR